MDMQNRKDLEIEAFFAELKAKDLNIKVPKAPIFHKRKYLFPKIWVPIGIAAIFILVFYLFPREAKNPELEKDTLIIKLVQIEDSAPEFQIETASSIDIWESSTSSLLDLELQ